MFDDGTHLSSGSPARTDPSSEMTQDVDGGEDEVLVAPAPKSASSLVTKSDVYDDRVRERLLQRFIEEHLPSEVVLLSDPDRCAAFQFTDPEDWFFEDISFKQLQAWTRKFCAMQLRVGLHPKLLGYGTHQEPELSNFFRAELMRVRRRCFVGVAARERLRRVHFVSLFDHTLRYWSRRLMTEVTGGRVRGKHFRTYLRAEPHHLENAFMQLRQDRDFLQELGRDFVRQLRLLHESGHPAVHGMSLEAVEETTVSKRIFLEELRWRLLTLTGPNLDRMYSAMSKDLVCEER